MMKGSGLSAEIDSSAIPFLPGAVELATSGIIPGGTRDNRDYTNPFAKYADGISEVRQLLLNDAQTSGGLLIAVVVNKAEELLRRLDDSGVVGSHQIGQVAERNDKIIRIH